MQATHKQQTSPKTRWATHQKQKWEREICEAWLRSHTTGSEKSKASKPPPPPLTKHKHKHIHSQSSHGSLGAVIIICRTAPLVYLDLSMTRSQQGAMDCNRLLRSGTSDQTTLAQISDYRCFTQIIHTWKMSQASMCFLSFNLV